MGVRLGPVAVAVVPSAVIYVSMACVAGQPWNGVKGFIASTALF